MRIGRCNIGTDMKNTFVSNAVAVYYSLLVMMALARKDGMVSGIITKDTPNAAIISLSDAKFFVSLYSRGDCAGTIIGENFVVTAAHCVCNANLIRVFDYQDVQRSVVAVYRNPDRIFNCNAKGPNRNDVAVLEFLGNPFTNHDIRQVYADDDESARKIWIMGMGKFGEPEDFPTDDACEDGVSDGALREGFNIVDSTEDGVLRYYMTRSGSASLAREAIAQDGDSGGPALIQNRNDEWIVAGVHSGSSESNSCDWGSEDEYCRLSEHAPWMERATDPSKSDFTRGLWLSSSNGFLVDSTSGGAFLQVDCFSSENTVWVQQHQQHKQVRISDVKRGDRVLTGNGNYQPIYSIDHQHSEKFAEFVQIKYSLLVDHNGVDDVEYSTQQQQPPLELSDRHMVFLEGRPDHPIPASHVKVGDKLLSLLSSSGDDNSDHHSFVVTTISKIVRKGFYNPLTADGTIVVNGGIVASTYSAVFLNNDQTHTNNNDGSSSNESSSSSSSSSWIEIFDSRYKIMTHQSFFHTILKPYRYMCTTTAGIATSTANKHIKNQEERVFISRIAHQFYTRWLLPTQQQQENNNMLMILIVSFVCAINFVLGCVPANLPTCIMMVFLISFALLHPRRGRCDAFTSKIVGRKK